MRNVLFQVVAVVLFAVLQACGGEAFDSDVLSPKSDSGVDVKDDTSPDKDVGVDADAGEDAAVDAPVEADATSEAATDASEDVEDASVDVLPDTQPDSPPEAEADTSEDVEADAPAEAQTDAPHEGQQPVDCELYGVPGKVTIIMRHAAPSAPKVLALAGKLTYNDVTQNTAFLTWCWAGINEEELVCEPLDKLGHQAQVQHAAGMKVQFAPGQTGPGVQLTNTEMFCSATGCPEDGDYLVCDGKTTLCRWNYGVESGPTSTSMGPWGEQDLVCSLP